MIRPATLLRLARAGTRTDTARIALTGFAAALATLAFLAAATVIAVPTVVDQRNNRSPQYGPALLAEAGLRPGVAATLLLLAIPVLALAGQCARLGAPARNSRLAAIRLAGGTPGQVRAIAATETGLAAGIGALVGLAAYLIGRELLHRPDANGLLPLPTDVLPPVWALLAIVAGIPLLATVVAAAMLRQVTISPYGVHRRVRERRPGIWPGLLIVGGVVVSFLIRPLVEWIHRQQLGIPLWVVAVLAFTGALATAIGVAGGTGWISYATGRLLLRAGRGPATLLAARRLLTDPWHGARTFAGLLVCILFGAGTAGYGAYMTTEFDAWEQADRQLAEQAGQPYYPTEYDFYLNAVTLVQLAVLLGLIVAAGGLAVAVAESVVSRRRAHAALVATGVPRSVLARSILIQALAPLVPASLLALASGVTMARGLGTEVSSGARSLGYCEPADACRTAADWEQYGRILETPGVTLGVPIPFADLAVLGGVGLLAALATAGFGLLFLRGTTDLAELRSG
ncbi:ABC transporter permease [Solwaraspora sp. WMMD406]|uniref:FtsX-like permease family protein n=1 Tax=Solwaraspora sp. WMMD406 TaxID=3016095 RepID=UPI002417AEB4|nr:FtsX-like permease family protein [Solwaraspora sp. WMMD406]MDG4762765.1 ABC transporter permease [Solwaraspora sp. WMMD406]